MSDGDLLRGTRARTGRRCRRRGENPLSDSSSALSVRHAPGHLLATVTVQHHPPRLVAVATWEDGPEYAPLERPQYFADAPLPPLEQAPPVERPADGLPSSRPTFDQPSAPVAPLATLVPVPPDERDPARPFDVVTASLTSESGWGGGTDQPFVPTAPFGASAAVAAQPAQATLVGPPPAQAAPLGSLAPTSPSPVVPSPDLYAFPTPGTPGWFAPAPTTYGEQGRPGRVSAKQVVEAATPGLCICLAVGGLISVLSPVLLVVAVLLSTRVTVAQRAVRTAFRVAAGAVGFFVVVGLFRRVFEGEPWWSFVGHWSLLVCWVTLGVLLLVVWQALTRPPAQQPPSSNPWG